ncbi:polyprenyl synthetase family protein [Lutibaculum baratangense]|nr:polyprenyl synthetase family protein [Lutibaculum baratangense]
MKAVNELIIERTGSDVTLIPEVAAHLIDSGGKRLRPMLTLACAQMFGYRGDGHVKLAASVEFMHTATLLHDDVVDESELRRGKAAARMVWGNEASVLVGDFLLGQAFRMMVEVASLPALEVLSRAAAVIAEGEVMQLKTAHELETSEARYMAVIEAKTAALFASAAEVGAIVAGKGEAEREALRTYGHELGLAFQLIDDALDYSGVQAELGKRVGDDFRDGKITLPVLIAYWKGDDDEKSFWRTAMREGNQTDRDLSRAIDLMARHGALEETVARANAHGATAQEALMRLPETPHREALLDVVGFCVNRRF